MVGNPADRECDDMMEHFAQIKKIMSTMLAATSLNDVRRDAMRDVIDLCDDGIMHFTDDGR